MRLLAGKGMECTEKVVVTGASGFLGSHLTRRLLAEGHHVSVLVRNAAKLQKLGLKPHQIVEGDICEIDALRRAANGASVFFHLVSNFRTAKDSAAAHWHTNVQGTKAAYGVADAAGVRRFLYCSTIGVHGDVASSPATEDAPLNPGDLYQETKAAADVYVREAARTSKMETVVLRPTSMYGPGDMRMLKMFSMLAKRRFVMLGSCKANFHAVYIDDVIDGFLLAMRTPAAAGQTLFIGGPAYLPLRDYIFEAAKAVGAPAPWIRLPYGAMYAAAIVCEAVCTPIGVEPPLHRRRVRFFRNNRAFDIGRARRVLEYSPRISLEEGFKRTIAWYRAEGLI